MFFSVNSSAPTNLYRNNATTAGVSLGYPHNDVVQSPNRFDVPLFVDTTIDMLSPYYGTGTGLSNPYGHQFGNITLGAQLADMDRDGDLDLTFANGGINVLGAGEFQIVYKNNGKPMHKGVHVFTPSGTSYAAPFLVQSESSGMFTGTSSAWLSDAVMRAYDVKFIDLTADGSPDLFFTCNDQSPRFFVNSDSDDQTRNSAIDTDSVPDGIFVEDATGSAQ